MAWGIQEMLPKSHRDGGGGLPLELLLSLSAAINHPPSITHYRKPQMWGWEGKKIELLPLERKQD